MLLPQKLKKIKILKKSINIDFFKKFDSSITEILYKNTKIVHIYYLYYYFLRIFYRLVISYSIIKSDKIYNLKQNILFKLKYKRNLILNIYSKNKYKKYKSTSYLNMSKLNELIYLIIDIYKSKIIFLFTYLQSLSTSYSIRNVSKLIRLFKDQILIINKLNRGQLFKTIKKIKRYLFKFNKLIVKKIKDNKYNYFINIINLFIGLSQNNTNVLNLNINSFFNSRYISGLVYLLKFFLRFSIKYPNFNINYLIHKCIYMYNLNIKKTNHIYNLNINKYITSNIYFFNMKNI